MVVVVGDGGDGGGGGLDLWGKPSREGGLFPKCRHNAARTT